MKIDKSRFLLLTTSIAATATAAIVATSGCTSSTTSTDAGATGTTDSGTDGTTTTGDTGTTGDGGSDSGAACYDNSGTAPLCGPANEGEDAGAYAKCTTECDAVSGLFKTQVAVAINTCLETAPTCEGGLADCVKAALPEACEDTTAAAYCTSVIEGCTAAGTANITQTDCLLGVTALSEEGRTKFTTCTEESSCEVCLDNLEKGIVP